MFPSACERSVTVGRYSAGMYIGSVKAYGMRAGACSLTLKRFFHIETPFRSHPPCNSHRHSGRHTHLGIFSQLSKCRHAKTLFNPNRFAFVAPCIHRHLPEPGPLKYSSCDTTVHGQTFEPCCIFLSGVRCAGLGCAIALCPSLRQHWQ